MSTVPPLQSLLDNPRYGELQPDQKVEALRAWEKDEIERRNTSGDWDLDSRANFEVETRRARQAALGIEPQSPEEILRGVIEDENDPEAAQVWDALDEVQTAEREQREINRRRVLPWMREDEDATLLEAAEGRIVAAKSGVSENEIEQARLGAEALQGKRDAAVVRGKIVLNPELYYDRERYVAAVNAASATPREKARALAGFYRGREETAKAALPKLKGVGAFRSFADTYATENPEATNGDVVEAFRKSGAGDMDKWYESISSGFLSAMEGVGYLGFAAGELQKKLGNAADAVGLETFGAVNRASGNTMQNAMLAGLAETNAAKDFSADRVQTLGGASTAQQYGQVGGQLFGQVALTMLSGPMSSIGKTAATAATKKALAAEVGKKLGVGGLAKKWGKETVQTMFSPAGVMAGASSAGPALYESYERNRTKLAAEGLTGAELEEAARGEAFVDATRSALITSTITSLFGLRGVEGVGRLTQVAANPAAREVIKKTVKERWGSVGLGALSEGVEEALDEGINGGLDALLENPDMTFEDWQKATLFAGSAGALFGGGIEGVTQIAEAVAERVKNSPEILARQQTVQSLRASGLNQTADALEQANVVAESDAVAAAIDEVEARAVGAVERLDAIDTELVDLAKTPGTETRMAELEAERDSLNEALMIGRNAMRNYDPVKTANIAVADVVAEGVEPEEARRRVTEVMNSRYTNKPVTPQILAAQALTAPAPTDTQPTDEKGILQTEANAQTEAQASEVTTPAPVSPVTPVKAEPTFRAIAGRPAIVDNETGDIRIDEDGTVLLDRGPSAPPIIVSRDPDAVLSTSEFSVTIDEETEADVEQARVLRTTIGGRPTPRPIERPKPSSTFVRDDGSIVTSFSGERGPVAAVTDFVSEGETEAGDLFVTVKDRETGSEFELHGDDALTVAVARRDSTRDVELSDEISELLADIPKDPGGTQKMQIEFDRVLVRLVKNKPNLLRVTARDSSTASTITTEQVDAAFDELTELNDAIENENFPIDIKVRLGIVVDDAFNDIATVRARVRQRPEAPTDRGTPAPATPLTGGAEETVDPTPSESPATSVTNEPGTPLPETPAPVVDAVTDPVASNLNEIGSRLEETTPLADDVVDEVIEPQNLANRISGLVDRADALESEIAENKNWLFQNGKKKTVATKAEAQTRRSGIEQSEKELGGLGEELEALRETDQATKELKPAFAKAVDTYNIPLPEGYVKEGDLYVYRSTKVIGSITLADDVVETAIAATEGNPEARAELMAALTPEQRARFETAVVSDNIEGRIVTVRPDGRVQVQSEENRQRAERGERQIGGDRIFNTREEAETETRREIEIDRRNAASAARDEEARAAREEAAQAKAAPLKAYLDDTGLKGVTRGRVESTLSTPRSVRNTGTGKVYGDTRFDVIQQVIADGGRVEAKAGKKTEFRLYSDQDTFWDINKTEYDAGLWVMAKNEPVDDFPVDPVPLDASPTGPVNNDAAYLSAVESGDMETAQRMVDEAAKAKGGVQVFHHGSFDPEEVSTIDTTRGFHMGSEQAARERAFGKPVDDFIINGEVTFDEDLGAWFWSSEGIDSYDVIDENGFESQEAAQASLEENAQAFAITDDLDTEDLGVTSRFYAFLGNPKQVSDQGSNWDSTVARAREEGFDAISYINQFEDKGSTSYIAFNPNQIKSADPVTYDESGNVIPLSQRFNPESNSILETAPSNSFTEDSDWQDVTNVLLDRAIAKYPKIPVTKDSNIPAPARTLGLRILVNPEELARYTEGMEVADAAEMIEKIFMHEATHRHAVAEVGDNTVVEYANTMTADERTDVAFAYLHRSAYPSDEAYLKAVTDFAAVDPNLPAGERKVRLYRLGHEALRMSVERLTSGYTTEETLAFLQTNPGNLQRFLRYLGAYLRRLKQWFAARKGPVIGVEVKRLARVLKTLTKGETSPRGAAPFDPDAVGSGRQLVGLNAGPVKQNLWRLTDGRTEWITDGDPVPVASTLVRSQMIEENPSDAAYLSAVESGDMETAKRMVDEAARAAGYNRKGVRFGYYVNGVPLPPSRSGELNFGPGYYIAEDATLENQTSGSVSVSATPNNIELKRLGLKPEDVEFRRDEVFVRAERPYESQYGGNYSEETSRFVEAQLAYDSAVQDYNRKFGLPSEQTNRSKTVADLIAQGRIPFDSRRGMTGRAGMSSELVVQNASQIKSAAPVTYDESGQVIPLSQRFNPASDSILETAKVGIFNRPKAKTYVPGGGLTAAYRWDRRVYKMLEAARGEYSGYMKKAEFFVRDIARLSKDLKVAPEAINKALGNTDNRLTQADLDQIKAIKKRGLAAAQGVYLSARNKAKALDTAGMFADAALARQDAKKQFDLDVQTYQRAAATYEARARKAAAAKAYADRQAAMAALPKPLADVVANLRTEIDLLSARMIAEGDLSAEVQATISNNMELWLHRSYQIFDDPNYVAWINEQKDPEAIRLRNKTITFLRHDLVTRKIGELMAGGMDRTSATAQAQIEVTDDHVDDAFDDYLMVADNGSKTLLTGATVSKEVSALMKRGVIPEEIQELWGRYDDPAVNAAKSIGAIAQHLAIHKFYQDLVALGTKEGWLVKDAPGVLKRDAQGNRLEPLLPNNGMAGRYGNQPKSQYSPLAGYLGPEALKDALAQMIDDRAGHRFVQFFTQLTGYSMASKTVLSWQSGMRNFWGNVLPSMINGNVSFDPRKWGRYKDATAGSLFTQLFGRGSDQTRAYVERATALGVLGDSITDNLIRDLTGGFDSDKKAVGFLGKVIRAKMIGPLINWGRKTALKTYDVSGKAYNMPDEFWKIVNFEGEKARLRAMLPNETEEQIEVRAAEIVRNTMPTYSRAPEWVKVLRKFPVMAPFITFPAEMVRITLGQGKVGLDFIREGKATGNKKMQAAGYWRLLASGIVAGVVGSIPMIFKAISDVSTDDEDDLRKHLAPWEKNVTLLFLGRNEDDPSKINYQNLSFMNPYDIWLRPWRSFMRGMRDPNADTLGIAQETLSELVDPIAKEQILFGALIDTRRGVTATGTPIWDDSDTPRKRAEKSMAHIYKSALEPGTIASIRNIGRAANDEVRGSGKAYDLWQETISAGLGLKIGTVDVKTSLGYATQDYHAGRRNSSSTFSRVIKSRGTQKDEDIINAYVEANDKMLRTYRELYEKTVGAVRLGAMTRQEAVKILRAEDVPADVIGDILNNRFRRITLTPESLRDVRQQSEKLGQDRINLYRQALDRVPAVQQISEDTFF